MQKNFKLRFDFNGRNQGRQVRLLSTENSKCSHVVFNIIILRTQPIHRLFGSFIYIFRGEGWKVLVKWWTGQQRNHEKKGTVCMQQQRVARGDEAKAFQIAVNIS